MSDLLDSLERLQQDAALRTVVTHADPMAVASAVALAFGVAHLLHRPPGELDPEVFIRDTVEAIFNVPDPGHPDRRESAGPEPFRLADRLAEVPGVLDRPPEEAFSYLYNGAFVLESLPATFWSFLHSPEDPERTLVSSDTQSYEVSGRVLLRPRPAV